MTGWGRFRRSQTQNSSGGIQRKETNFHHRSIYSLLLSIWNTGSLPGRGHLNSGMEPLPTLPGGQPHRSQLSGLVFRAYFLNLCSLTSAACFWQPRLLSLTLFSSATAGPCGSQTSGHQCVPVQLTSDTLPGASWAVGIHAVFVLAIHGEGSNSL